MAREELGTKRTCAACSTKYYDLNRDPIVCPECSSVFEPIVPSIIEEEVVEVQTEKVAEGVEVVSLEETETVEADPAKIDIDVDDDEDIDVSDDDDTFLEQDDDDEDDGVATIIRTDVKTEDE